MSAGCYFCAQNPDGPARPNYQKKARLKMNAVELYNDLFSTGVLCLIPAFLAWLLWVISLIFGDDFMFAKVMFFSLLITGFVLIFASGVVQCTYPEVKAHLLEKDKVTCECSCCHCNEVPGTSKK